MTTGTNSFAGMGCTSDARNVGIGWRGGGLCLNMLPELVASLRSLARIQPSCTNVSLPSGRTSLTVAWRSTSGVDDLTQSETAPAPIAAVVLVSAANTWATAEPAGGCAQFHSHSEALPQSPPEPVLAE